ncbi:hypothetical protein CEP51_008674 [Fusarium floridanum]|uniref:Zn(2)-C6 fungal-type domain-containing protein n=1 Tax=Fusarium floridanum TaxID=1325733 RepID=A0A428RK44_9HYPO|nr:hypothetical protein CEP51_008674 [Fusarium floridanum]
MVDNSRRDRSRARIRKTSEICAQCRNRKVRCDGDPRGCSNCKRLRFECSLLTSSTDKDGLPELLERRRVWRACIRCRDRKLKCSGESPACSRCAQRGVTCQYPSSATVVSINTQGVVQPASFNSHASTSQQMQSQGSSHPEPAQITADAQSGVSTLSLELGVDKLVVKQHIDAFFEFIYPIPCYGFLHRASLLQAWSRGQLSPLVLRAICSLTTRFIHPNDPKHADLARKWIQETESELLSRLAEPRVSDVEAWLLVTLDQYLSRQFSKMLVSMSLTSRLAYILRLNHENDRPSFLLQERRRRLMWSIFTTDTLYSSGKTEFTCCTTETLHIRLPCNEKSFSMDMPVSTGLLSGEIDASGEPNIGLLGYCLRVLDIRDRCQRLTLKISNHRKLSQDSLTAVQSIENELQRFSSSLPERYRFDVKSFSLRAFSPSRTPFLMLHAWWHQTHCDLFRFAIPGFREGLPIAEISQLSPEFATSCREKCLAHALSVSRILETPKLVGGADLISDPSLAMCAFHSARIISRLGQHPMGNLPQDELVARLSACAAALGEQAIIYPTSAILKKGIMDLVSDAQRDRDGQFACPSIWEEEERETNPLGSSAILGGGATRQEIYSKHSVSEVVQSLHFEPGDVDEDNTNTQEAAGTNETDSAYHESRGNLMNLQPTEVQRQTTMPEHLDTSMHDFDGYLGGSLGYSEEFLALGADPRHDYGQPDLFMDSFWPLMEGDWMPGQV